MVFKLGMPTTICSTASSRLQSCLCLLACVLMLTGCMDASTKGGEAADHIIISGTPTWSNGISKLMTAKCAVCHQVPRLASSPQNVPADLDLRYETSTGMLRASEDIAAQITLGILRHSIDYRPGTVTVSTMPLRFGTALYTDEINALETWAVTVVNAEKAYTSPVLSGNAVADGALLYKRNCQSCHGMYGAGGLVQRPVQRVTAVQIANAILTTTNPMNSWPVLVQFANQCTPIPSPTDCSGSQLSKIVAYLAQF